MNGSFRRLCAQQPGRCELRVRGERSFVRAVDQRHVRTHHVADHFREVWIVRASEQQRVDASLLNRGEQSLGENRYVLAGGLTALDELDEARACASGELHIVTR